MKKLLLLLIAVVAINTVASAQGAIKFGLVRSGEIIEAMPETDSIKTKISKREAELQEQINHMRDELQRKYAAFEKDAPNLSGLIAEQRKQDIIDLQTKLENFSREAQNDLMQYQQQLTAPIFKKVQDAIDKVSKINLLTAVIDESSNPPFVYYNKAQFKDITALVKAELKISTKK